MNDKSSDIRGRRQFLRSGMPLAVAAAGGLLTEAACAANAPEKHAGAPANMSALRQLPIPADGDIVHLAGYHKPGDGGGGAFVWDAHYDPGSANLADDGGTYLLPKGNASNKPGRWRRVASGPMNVKWFGALGDNTGKTPAGAGIDITDAPWNNNWPKWIAETRPLHTAQFTNADSWDYIGTQLALLSASTQTAGDVYLPAGTYRLSQHLLFTGNMHPTLTGAGMYQTILTKTENQFKNNFLIRMFDTAALPTTIRDLCLMGPTDAQSQYNHKDVNFTLILLNHTNGVHIENCWLTSCHVGLFFSLATDCYVTNCTAEYCGTAIKMDRGTDLHVLGCNLWQSAPATERYTGIESEGTLHSIGNRFAGFEGYAINCTAGTLQANGNFCLNFTHSAGVIEAAQAGQSVISGNRLVGGTIGPMVAVGQDSVVTGNYIEQHNDHACINLAAGKTNINVSGNMVCSKPADKKIFEGGLIISVLPNVNFSGGCSECLITGNTLNQPNSITVEAHRNVITNNLMAGNA